ncbi:MAG: YqeG family HAD IIIA-type phosphatase [bacterium]|nr:YqeG family HAD IIIA-type phosphatase [bacterium]
MKFVKLIKPKIKKVLKNILNYLAPKFYFEKITDIDLNKLKKNNIDTVLLDLDNTLVPWYNNYIDPEIYNWLNKLKSANFKVCIISNGLSIRVKRISKDLGFPFISNAIKPSTRSIVKALRMLNSKPENTVIIGDQIFTDILAGNRLGLTTILVKPLAKVELITTKFIRIIEKKILRYLINKNKIKIIKHKEIENYNFYPKDKRIYLK